MERPSKVHCTTSVDYISLDTAVRPQMVFDTWAGETQWHGREVEQVARHEAEPVDVGAGVSACSSDTAVGAPVAASNAAEPMDATAPCSEDADLALYEKDTSSDNETLLEIVRARGQLRSLSLAHCGQICDNDLRQIAPLCTRLQVLKVKWCMCVTEQGIAELLNQCGPQLHTLRLSIPYPEVGEQLVLIAPYCRQLKTLCLSQCGSLGDAGLMAMAQHCPLLRELHIGFNCRVTDTGVLAIVRACPRLEVLKIKVCSEVTDAALREAERLRSRLRVETSSLTCASELRASRNGLPAADTTIDSHGLMWYNMSGSQRYGRLTW